MVTYFNKAIKMKTRHKEIISVLVMMVPKSKHAVMQLSYIFMLDCVLTGVCARGCVRVCICAQSKHTNGRKIHSTDRFLSGKTNDSLLKK